MRIALFNPNNSARATEAMLRIARSRAPEAEMAGLTTPFGAALITDGAGLVRALDAACRDAIAAGAEAVVIGGGPLARAGEALAAALPVALIAPVPAALRLTAARLERAS